MKDDKENGDPIAKKSKFVDKKIVDNIILVQAIPV